MKQGKSFFTALLSLALLFCGHSKAIPLLALEKEESGDKPYTCYSYNSDGEEMPGPAPYYPAIIKNGRDMGTTSLYNPSDLFVDEKNGYVFIADTGNKRVVITDSELEYLGEIVSYEYNGEERYFSGPTGLYLTGQDELYVADKSAGCIVRLKYEGSWVCGRIYGKPDSALLDSGAAWLPGKVAVSKQGNIYEICEGIYEGIVEVDEENVFQGYAGMNLSNPSPWQLFLRAISTREQKSAMRAFIPIEFANFDMDEKDFIYATSQLEGNNTNSAVKRLNPGGYDVLNTKQGLVGDRGNIYQGRFSGRSYFTDICYLENGMFVCLDFVRSHMFLYDSDGMALAVFGDSGNQKGQIMAGAAIDNMQEHLYVLDSARGTVCVYRPTEYGMTLMRAVRDYRSNDYDAVLEDYRELLRMNSNSDVAYSGIGKVLLRQENYRGAMQNFALAKDWANYSKALGKYRNEMLSDYFLPIFLMAVLILLWFAAKPWRRRLALKWGFGTGAGKKQFAKEKSGGGFWIWADRQLESLDFGTYVMFHPFKGFWMLKREGRGTLAAAWMLLAGFSVVNVCDATFTGCLFNPSYGKPVNTLYEAAVSLLPVALFVVANWCFTTLMDGDGSFRDIFIATCYALLPFIIIKIPIILVSNFLTLEEGSILKVAEGAMYLFMFLLIFVGNLTIHQYTGGKALGMLILTVLGMAVIIFLGFLFVNLGFEVAGFIEAVYKEITFRY